MAEVIDIFSNKKRANKLPKSESDQIQIKLGETVIMVRLLNGEEIIGKLLDIKPEYFNVYYDRYPDSYFVIDQPMLVSVEQSTIKPIDPVIQMPTSVALQIVLAPYCIYNKNSYIIVSDAHVITFLAPETSILNYYNRSTAMSAVTSFVPTKDTPPPDVA